MNCFRLIIVFFLNNKSAGILAGAAETVPVYGVYQLNAKGQPVKLLIPNTGSQWQVEIDEGALEIKKGGSYETATDTGIDLPNWQPIGVAAPPTKMRISPQIRALHYEQKKEIKSTPAPVYREPPPLPAEPVLPAAVATIESRPPPEQPKPWDPNFFNGFTFDLAGALSNFLSSFHFPSWNLNLPGISLPDFPYPSVNVKIPLTIKKVLENVNMQQPLQPDICPRDYRKTCPAGWTYRDAKCLAPKSYDGPCPHSMVVETTLLSQEKEKIQSRCKVKWPCMDERCKEKNGFDYSSPCPESWQAGSVCKAPAWYQGPCSKEINLVTGNETDKESIALQCQAPWPCRASCTADYSSICPNEFVWKEDLDGCAKMPESKIPTDFIQGKILRTNEQRREYSAQNHIKWPCQEHKARCQSDFSSRCPHKWTDPTNSGLCFAPQDYNPPAGCSDLVHFDFATRAEKQLFSTKCHVHWGCPGEMAIQNAACPINWAWNEKDGHCLPPKGYQGPCNWPIDAAQLTTSEIETIARICSISFFPKITSGSVQIGQDRMAAPQPLAEFIHDTRKPSEIALDGSIPDVKPGFFG